MEECTDVSAVVRSTGLDKIVMDFFMFWYRRTKSCMLIECISCCILLINFDLLVGLVRSRGRLIVEAALWIVAKMVLVVQSRSALVPFDILYRSLGFLNIRVCLAAARPSNSDFTI